MNRKMSLAMSLVFSLLLPLAQAVDPPLSTGDLRAPAAAPRPRAVNRPSAPGEKILVLRCVLNYHHAANLGVSVPGILQERLAELGDRVKAGQVLGRLQDLEQRASIGVAAARMQGTLTQMNRARPLLDQHAFAPGEWDNLRAQLEINKNELEAAKAAVRVREIVSPFDGVVVKVFKEKGESVLQGNDPVFRVVNPELLQVIGHLDVVDAWRVQPGQTVRLLPDLAVLDKAIRGEVFSGQVVFVDAEIDTKTWTCQIVAQVANRNNLLRSGLELQMEIDTVMHLGSGGTSTNGK